MFVAFIWLVEWWGNSNLEFYGDKSVIEKFSKRKSFITLNHYGDLDWLVGWVFSERLGGLGVRYSLFYALSLLNVLLYLKLYQTLSH